MAYTTCHSCVIIAPTELEPGQLDFAAIKPLRQYFSNPGSGENRTKQKDVCLGCSAEKLQTELLLPG